MPSASISNSESHPKWAPFRIEPKYVKRVWGFRDLRPWFDYVTEPEPVGEVWLTGDDCEAATGFQAGRKLGDLFHSAGEYLLGPGGATKGSPLLIKLIFASEKLSVQVHPDDGLAQKYGQPRGKTECWYALSAEPGAHVAVGLRPGVSLDEVKAGIQSGTLEEDLNVVSVQREDMILVDAGTVHAIWPGSILLEVQQNSDITYRLYDYGRPRELHIEKGLEATKIATEAGKVAPRTLPDRTLLLDSGYFRIERIQVDGQISSEQLRATPGSDTGAGLSYLFASAGRGSISGVNIPLMGIEPRSVTCVPSASPEFVVENGGGLELIRITPKWATEPE